MTSPRNLLFAIYFSNCLWALRNTQQYEGKSLFYIEWKLIETDRFMCLEIASRKFCCMWSQEIKNILVSAFRTLLNKQRYRWNSRNRNRIVLSIEIHNLNYKFNLIINVAIWFNIDMYHFTYVSSLWFDVRPEIKRFVGALSASWSLCQNEKPNALEC